MDQAWYLHLNGWAARTPAVGALAVATSNYGIVLYVFLLLGLWWWSSSAPNRPRRLLLLSLIAALLALGVNTILNVALPRPRPFLLLPAYVLVASPPRDPSFPSDHAALTSAIALMLLAGGETRWGTVGVLGAVMIGLSRIMVGVHYPSDIFGGMLVGAVCAGAVLGAEPLLRPVLNFLLKLARRLRLA